MKAENFLKGGKETKRFIFGALVLLLVFMFLGGCSPKKEATDYEKYVASLEEGCEPVPQDCFEQAIEEGELNMWDWAEWWPDEIFDGFTEEFGIKVTRDPLSDFDEIVTKFKLDPELEYDLTVPSTRAFLQLREIDVLQKLDHDWIPNVNKYLEDTVKNAWYDPNYQYNAPIDIAYTCYVYNTKYVDDPRVPSWSVLLEPDEKYEGRVVMWDDMYEAIGSALRYLGYSYNSDNEDELNQAKEILLKQKPYLLAYDFYPHRIVVEEEAWIAGQWLGDYIDLNKDVPTIRSALPEDGTRYGLDIHVIPKGAKHPAAAHLFINYLWRPKINALLFNDINYTHVHTGIEELLSEELRSLKPSEEYLKKCEIVSPKAFTGKGLELRTAIWEEVKK